MKPVTTTRTQRNVWRPRDADGGLVQASLHVGQGTRRKDVRTQMFDSSLPQAPQAWYPK